MEKSKWEFDNSKNRRSLAEIAVSVTILVQHTRQRKHAVVAVMKTNLSFLCRFLTGITPLFAGVGVSAGPLVWFPGPTLDAPRSGSATTLFSGGNNLLIGGDSTVVQELAGTNVFWTYLTPFGYAAFAPGAVAAGGMVVVYGGNDGTSSTSAVIGYSPTDGSAALASMSVARSYLGYAPDRNGNAYAFGGLDDTGRPLSSAEAYSQDSTTWAAIASLPTALYNFPAVFNGTNYIYTFGGRTNAVSGTETATVLRYSVSANTWTAMAPLPVATAGSAAAWGADGKFYVVGGVSGGVAANVVQAYDPGANSWEISTPLPEGLSASALGVDSLGRLIVMGGADSNGNDVSDVWRSQQLGVPDVAPAFTQLPGTNGIYQSAYSSSINASGNPQPVYLVVSGPAGLQVDYYSGAITWTPQGIDQIGAVPVTIEATNYAGVTNWTFTIAVPNPPPAAPTNIHVISSTENSVTLAWDPESQVVGPTTFSVFVPHPYHSPRGSGGGVNYSLVGSTTTTNITISNLVPNRTYAYDLNATAAGGKSGYAGVDASTLGPQPPGNLRVTGITSTSISLAWDPSPGPVPIVRYEILGWIGGLLPTIEYGSNFVGTTATITGLTPGTYEEWTALAYDADGNASSYAAGIYADNPVPAAAQLSSVAPTASGGFQFTASEGGSVLQTVLIQATTNPADSNSWVQIGSLLPTTNPFTFTDTNAAQYPMRFYRVVAP